MNKHRVMESIAHRVENELHKYNVPVPFFIAGGCVNSVYNHVDEFSDVDVYFYRKRDMYRVVKRITDNSKNIILHNTKNALTIVQKGFNHPIQFIKKECGEPKDVMKTFDYSSSCIAFTHAMEIIKGDNYSKELLLNFDAMSNTTVNRYFKYMSRGSTDKNLKTLEGIIDFLIDHRFEEMKTSYESNYKQLYKDEFRNIIFCSMNTFGLEGHDEVSVLLHDMLQRLGSDSIEIYSELLDYSSINAKDASIEYITAAMLSSYAGIFIRSVKSVHPERLDEAKSKYAEYFI